jgi:hypothetical protein
MTGPRSFADAFERNCPCVRLEPDERAELKRLFGEAIKWAKTEGRRELAEELHREAKV